MNECKSENATGTGAADPIEAVSYRLSDDILNGNQQLDEDESSDTASVKGQYLSNETKDKI